MAFYLEYAVKGVASGIGLASESIHAHKEKKKQKTANILSTDDEIQDTAEFAAAMETHKEQEIAYQREQEIEYQRDETLLDLDDAQDELIPQPNPGKKTRDLKVIVDTFAAKYPTSMDSYQYETLALPVLLPQRRPNSRSRGFVRAYAPILENNGIDQAMFLDFLQTFDEAAQASPYLNLINLASFAGLALGPLGILVNIPVMITKMTAQELNGRARFGLFQHSMSGSR